MSENNPPNTTIARPVQEQERIFHDAASVETWYRNLRPDTDIRTVDALLLVDAIATTVLDMSDQPVPDDSVERSRRFLQLTSDAERTTDRLVLAGPSSLLVGDLILELCQNMGGRQPSAQLRLLDFGQRISLNVRNDLRLSIDERLPANKKLASLRQMQLLREFQAGTLGDTPERKLTAIERARLFSDKYIQGVRAEANWLVRFASRANTGDLFETMIGILSKYSLWEQETETDYVARHATLREDVPLPRTKGGSGFEFAHDVAILLPEAAVRLQCKYYPARKKLEDEQSGVTVAGRKIKDASRYCTAYIEETADDGFMDTAEDMIAVFRAITDSADEVSGALITKCIERYGLDDPYQLLEQQQAKQRRIPAFAGHVATNGLRR